MALLLSTISADGNIGDLKDVLKNAFEKSLDEVYKKYQNNPLLQQSIQQKKEQTTPVVSQQIVKPKDVVFKRRILKKVLNNDQKDENNRTLDGLNPLAMIENLMGNQSNASHPQIRGFVSEVKSFTGPDGHTRVEHMTEPINGGFMGNMLDKPEITIEDLGTPVQRENPLEMLLDGGLRPKPKQITMEMEIPLKKPTLNIEPTINPLLDLMGGNMGGGEAVRMAPRLNEPEIIVEEIPRLNRPINDLIEERDSSSDEDHIPLSLLPNNNLPLNRPKKKVNPDELGDLLGDFLSNEIEKHEASKESVDEDAYHNKVIEPDVVIIGGDELRKRPQNDPFTKIGLPIRYDAEKNARLKNIRKRRRSRIRRQKRIKAALKSNNLSQDEFPIMYESKKPNTRPKRIRKRRRRIRRRKRVFAPKSDNLSQNQFVTQLADLLMKPAEKGKLLDDTQLSRKADPLSIRVERTSPEDGLLNILTGGLGNEIDEERPNLVSVQVRPNKIRIADKLAKNSSSDSDSSNSSEDNMLDKILNNKSSSSTSEEEIDPDNHYPLLNQDYKSYRRPFKTFPTVGHRNGGKVFLSNDIENLLKPLKFPYLISRNRKPGPILHKRRGGRRRRINRYREPGPILHKRRGGRRRRINRYREPGPILHKKDGGGRRRINRYREPGPILHKKDGGGRRRIKISQNVNPILSADDLNELAQGILLPLPFKERKLNMQRRS